MDGNWIVFTGPGCAYCPQAKKLLADHEIEYQEVVIDSREKFQFMEQHAPGIKSVPCVVHNGVVIVGYPKLVEYLEAP
jgi:glutaredoxin